jgi:hypothetical protein
MKSAGSMPGRPGCQLFSFNQDDISPAQFGQVIQHRGTDYAATDDNYTRMFFQWRGHYCPPKEAIQYTPFS